MPAHGLAGGSVESDLFVAEVIPERRAVQRLLDPLDHLASAGVEVQAVPAIGLPVIEESRDPFLERAAPTELPMREAIRRTCTYRFPASTITPLASRH